MGVENRETEPSERGTRQERYLAEVRTRARSGRYQSWARALAAQAIWLVVMLAGAAIPVNAALGGPSWAEPWLGFIVVAAAGIERIFARTGRKAAAVDVLRRDLEQTKRRLEATASWPYSEDRFARFVEDCESRITIHNRDVIKQNRRLFGG